MMPAATSADEIPGRLLEQTLRRWVAADATLTHARALAIGAGMSGAPVQRYGVDYTTTAGGRQIQLVTKLASLREWRVLEHLNAQRQPNIPFAHTLGEATADQLLVCLQDMGDITRPTSLEPITDSALRGEAIGLAAIHYANFGQAHALGWLPQMDRTYVRDYLLGHCWRPAWEQALANPGFVQAFRADIPAVEAAAAQIVDDMGSLVDETDTHTLIHADINPSNVLVHNATPYFIDWQAAMRGPFYLDLPHHHSTLRQAEHYRQALAALGRPISRADFAERYRIAARYIGLRYIWWTLEYWQEDHSQAAWVQHYIGLIRGVQRDAS